jgi:hypothetical protein
MRACADPGPLRPLFARGSLAWAVLGEGVKERMHIMLTTSALMLWSVAASVATPHAASRAPTVAADVTVQQPHRISGTTSFTMPRSLENEMDRTGDAEMDYRGQLCVGRDGVPTSLHTTERTRVRAADREVAKTVLSWRFAPYRVDGHTVPFCESVRYRFEMPAAGMIR